MMFAFDPAGRVQGLRIGIPGATEPPVLFPRLSGNPHSNALGKAHCHQAASGRGGRGVATITSEGMP